MPGNQVPRNREEENETNYRITILRSAWGEINCRSYVHWSVWECWLRFDNIFNCSEVGILSLSFTNWLIFSKQIIMQLGLARNYKPSALKTSVNEVFQYLILLAATSNCKKNCQCTSIREPSKSRAQLRLIANWHEIFIITKRSTFNWNLKKKGLVKPVLPNFDFKLCHFGNNYDIKCRNSNQLFSG